MIKTDHLRKFIQKGDNTFHYPTKSQLKGPLIFLQSYAKVKCILQDTAGEQNKKL